MIARIGLLFLTMLLVSCMTRNEKSDTFSIEGSFSNCAGEKALLNEMDIRTLVPLDSTIIDASGHVNFKERIGQPGFFLLKLGDKKKIILLLDKNEKLEIAGDCQNPIETFVFKGSPGSALLSEFFKISFRNQKSVDSLKTLLHDQEGTPDFMNLSIEADNAFRRIADNQRRTELEFLATNSTSLACLIVLNYSFGPKPILDIDRDFFVYSRVDSNLQRVYPGNKHVIYHHQRIRERIRQETVKGFRGKQEKAE
jgi:hypothetical protein